MTSLSLPHDTGRWKLERWELASADRRNGYIYSSAMTVSFFQWNHLFWAACSQSPRVATSCWVCAQTVPNAPMADEQYLRKKGAFPSAPLVYPLCLLRVINRRQRRLQDNWDSTTSWHTQTKGSMWNMHMQVNMTWHTFDSIFNVTLQMYTK